MAKQINFEYNGREYTLEFTRRTVQEMEREGFVTDDLENKPMSALPALFAGAFKAHHRFMKRGEIDEIYRDMPNKEKLIERLAEMYNEPISTLLSEPENPEKNVKWTANW